ALRGAGLGLVSGSVGGVVALTLPHLLATDRCHHTGDDFLCFSTGEWAALGLLLGAPMGLVTGAVTGFLFPEERWRSLSIPGAPVVAVSGRGDGVQLGVSIALP
ncbi:MAG TPA: hypothetical protein VK689_11580, partial [Armatimonadota bacterium]|nr:hypothetical protein [Armatimonadota bacterium]